MALCGDTNWLARSYSARAFFAIRRDMNGTVTSGNFTDLLTSRRSDFALYSTRSSLLSTSP